jgi:hypothetical protein
MVRVNGVLREKLKQDIPVVALFNHPNISSLAKFLSEENITDTVSTGTVKRDEAISKAQNRMQRYKSRNVRTKKNDEGVS